MKRKSILSKLLIVFVFALLSMPVSAFAGGEGENPLGVYQDSWEMCTMLGENTWYKTDGSAYGKGTIEFEEGTDASDMGYNYIALCTTVPGHPSTFTYSNYTDDKNMGQVKASFTNMTVKCCYKEASDTDYTEVVLMNNGILNGTDKTVGYNNCKTDGELVWLLTENLSPEYDSTTYAILEDGTGSHYYNIMVYPTAKAAGKYTYYITASDGTTMLDQNSTYTVNGEEKTAGTVTVTINKKKEEKTSPGGHHYGGGSSYIYIPKTEVKTEATKTDAAIDTSSTDAPNNDATNNAKVIAGVKATKVTAKTFITKNSKGKKSIKIAWTKSKGYKVDYYEVYKSTKKNSGYKKLYTTVDSNKNSLVTSKNLKNGKTYYFKVRGVRVIDGEKNYTKWSNKISKTYNK